MGAVEHVHVAGAVLGGMSRDIENTFNVPEATQ